MSESTCEHVFIYIFVFVCVSERVSVRVVDNSKQRQTHKLRPRQVNEKIANYGISPLDGVSASGRNNWSDSAPVTTWAVRTR